MDVRFAAKEISRFTSMTEEQDWRSAKRLARYLKDNRRVVVMYKYQKLPWKVICLSGMRSFNPVQETVVGCPG